MIVVNPYLNFNGTTQEAFDFYKSVFGGDFSLVQRFKDTPFGEKMADKEKDMIMHIALPVGKGTTLMGTDSLESQGQSLNVGNNFSLTIHTESEEEADKYFNAISAGGQVTMPLEKAFWGDYFGMCVDKFGIQWMVTHTPAK